MRRTLVSAGSPPPPTSPMSASAPETGRIGATYSAHNQRPHGIARASSNISNAHRNSTEKYGKRSRSALGLSSRSNSVSSSHSHHAGEAPTADPYAHQPHHPGYDAHPPRPSSTRSSSSTAETPKSTTSSTLSVHDDDVLSSMSITLSAERRQMLVDFVDRSVDDAYNLCHGFGSIRWLPSKIREGVSIYRAKSGELSDDPRLDASVRGKCNVSASFDEMLDTLITETTSDFVGHESTVNPGEFLDGQVLCVLVPRTRADRYVCVKWHCIKSHAPSVAKHRDYVYVEVVDTFTDRDGRKVGFRLSKSIDMEELNAYDHSAIFVRGKTLTLHTFSQVSPGNLELYTMMINDLGERLPPWLVQKIVDTAAMRSACLRDYINQKRLDLLVLARPKEMVPLHKRVCCVVCTRSFSIVRKKYNCVACGDVICNQCSVHEFVAPPSGMISDFVGKKKARICVKCSSNAKRREIPKRRASSAKPIATSGPLNEMDHRRASGSTIASSSSSSSASRASLARHQPYAEQYNRFMRSASSVDTTTTSLSTDSSGSYNEENGRVHPAATTDSTGRKTIPHMFNFRPTQPSTKTTTTEARSSGRSSGLSTSHTSSSPEDEASLPQDSNGADDEVVERPERHVSDADLDFDNLLDESALDRTVGQFDPEMDAAVAEYRKTLVNGSNAHDEHDDDELTDADDDDETFASPLTSSSGSTASSATPPASTVLGDIADEDGLIIEEISPQSSFHSATGQTPRHSSVSSASDEPTVKIVKPVIIKQHVKKRFGVGGSSRSKATTINKPEVAAAPASPPRSPVSESAPHVNPLRESIVVRSRRATLVDESADADTPAEEVEIQEAIQLADLQVHLDRMTMISESLRNLQKQQSLVDSPPKTAQDQAMADQLAHISNIGLRAQAEAALAAGFVQAIRDEANAKEPVATASFLDGGDNDEGEHMLGSSGDMHLVREDGSFSDYLADSSFSEISSTSPEGMAANFAPGWVAVHSMTTGKMYYYNESCGTTSWTMPTPDTNRKFGTYMVL